MLQLFLFVHHTEDDTGEELEPSNFSALGLTVVEQLRSAVLHARE